jgi:hypothetical protein
MEGEDLLICDLLREMDALSLSGGLFVLDEHFQKGENSVVQWPNHHCL